LIVLDATETLSALLVDGMPDPGDSRRDYGGSPGHAADTRLFALSAAVDFTRRTSEVARLRGAGNEFGEEWTHPSRGRHASIP
jgi:hypothetical protein